MDLNKFKKRWVSYNIKFSKKDLEIEEHISMASKVGLLIEEIERLNKIIKESNFTLNPCSKCGKEEANPGLSVCGNCYHKEIKGSDH